MQCSEFGRVCENVKCFALMNITSFINMFKLGSKKEASLRKFERLREMKF